MKNASTVWGGVFYLFFFHFNKEIIYSIRLVPGSSPGQPTTDRIQSYSYDLEKIFLEQFYFYVCGFASNLFHRLQKNFYESKLKGSYPFYIG